MTWLPLADLPAATAEQFWPFFVSLAALAGFVLSCLKIWSHIKGFKVSGHLSTSEAPKLATREDIDMLAKSLADHREETKTQFRQMTTEGQQRVAAITQGFDEDIAGYSQKLENFKDEVTKRLGELPIELRDHVSAELKEVYVRVNEHGERLAGLEARKTRT